MMSKAIRPFVNSLFIAFIILLLKTTIKHNKLQVAVHHLAQLPVACFCSL